MKLSIIIVHYKSWGKLDMCLEALNRCLIPEMEVIVVDNDSDNKIEEQKFLEKWLGKLQANSCKLIYLPSSINLGFAKGVNFGVKKTRGEYLLVMNPDVKLKENSLAKAINFLDQNKTTGILGGKLVYPSGEIQDSYRSFPSLIDQIIKRVAFLRKMRFLRKRVSRYLMWNKDPSKTEPVEWVVGAFMFIRKKAYDEVNGFDSRYFLFMEDVDICRQMWLHGYTVIYNPDTEAIHDETRLSPGSIFDIFKRKMLRMHLMSALKYFWKYKFQKSPYVKK